MNSTYVSAEPATSMYARSIENRGRSAIRKTLVALAAGVALSLALVSTGHADKPGTLGVGLGAGTIASGLSGKYYSANSIAFQANLGSFGGSRGDRFKNPGGVAASLDVLLERPAFVVTPVVTLEWNLGLGAGLGIRDDALGVAAAGVLGLEFNFVPVPIDLVLEYRPTLAILQDVDFEPIDLTGHLRFYFQ